MSSQSRQSSEGSELSEELLAKCKGKPIKVFLVSGKALSGSLLRYDQKAMFISGDREGSGETLIFLKHVSSITT